WPRRKGASSCGAAPVFGGSERLKKKIGNSKGASASQPLRRGFSFWNQSQRPALVSVRKTGILPRVMQSKTGMAQPRPSAGGAGLFLDPNMALGRAKNPPNVPHQYLDRHRYPSDALRRYSVPDARKRPFAYLQTTLPPRRANAEPHFLLDVRRRGA